MNLTPQIIWVYDDEISNLPFVSRVVPIPTFPKEDEMQSLMAWFISIVVMGSIEELLLFPLLFWLEDVAVVVGVGYWNSKWTINHRTLCRTMMLFCHFSWVASQSTTKSNNCLLFDMSILYVEVILRLEVIERYFHNHRNTNEKLHYKIVIFFGFTHHSK